MGTYLHYCDNIVLPRYQRSVGKEECIVRLFENVLIIGRT